MAKESLFNILMRQPWWVTLLVAFVLFWIVYAIFPPVAPFMTLPFVLLAAFIAFKQWRRGSPFDTAETLTTLRAMSWDEFSAVIARSYRRQGYTVAPSQQAGYDFMLTRAGRVTLVQCRRWKVSVVGAGPLRELARAVEREEAAMGICVSAGSFSAPALAVVQTEPVSVMAGDELAQLVGRRPLNRAGATQ